MTTQRDQDTKRMVAEPVDSMRLEIQHGQRPARPWSRKGDVTELWIRHHLVVSAPVHRAPATDCVLTAPSSRVVTTMPAVSRSSCCTRFHSAPSHWPVGAVPGSPRSLKETSYSECSEEVTTCRLAQRRQVTSAFPPAPEHELIMQALEHG